MRVTARKPKRPSLVRPIPLTVGLVLLAIIIAIITYFGKNDAPTETINRGTTAVASPVTTSPTPTPSIPQDQQTEFERLDNVQARSTLAKYNWHYRCRTYPPANVLSTNDLIPTANVVVTVKYDEKAKQYVASSNEHVKMSISTYTEPPGPDFKEPAEYTKLTWTYPNGGIKHYIVAEEFREANDAVKVSTLAGTYDQATKRYTLAFPTTDTRMHIYKIIATDSTTCEGKNTLTYKWWAQLRTNSLMAPDPVG